MVSLAQWLSETRASLFIHEFDWLVPLLQTIHILAIAMVISSVLMIDLRLLGIATSQSLEGTSRRFVPWIWTGLAILAASGLILIVAEPQRSLPNPAFQKKMTLLLLAITVTAFFQIWVDRNASSPSAPKANSSPVHALTVTFGVLTFFLWCAIVFAGRFIAYLQPA